MYVSLNTSLFNKILYLVFQWHGFFLQFRLLAANTLFNSRTVIAAFVQQLGSNAEEELYGGSRNREISLLLSKKIKAYFSASTFSSRRYLGTERRRSQAFRYA